MKPSPRSFFQLLLPCLVALTITFQFFPVTSLATDEQNFSWNDLIQFYRDLNIEPGATYDEARTAYRVLSSKYHPDKETGNVAKQQRINVAWGILEPILKRGGSAFPNELNQSTGTAYRNQFRDRENQAALEKTLKDIFSFYDGEESKNKSLIRTEELDKTEVRILESILTFEKQDFEAFVKHPGFHRILLRILKSSKWKDSKNGLFELVPGSWLFYSIIASPYELAVLLGGLDPNDPRLLRIIQDYDVKSLGWYFRTPIHVRNWLLPAKVALLFQPNYREGLARDFILASIHREWFDLIEDDSRNNFLTDILAIEILKLLDDPQLNQNRLVLSIVSDIPKLLKNRKLGKYGKFRLPNLQSTYEEIVRKYPTAFASATNENIKPFEIARMKEPGKSGKIPLVSRLEMAFSSASEKNDTINSSDKKILVLLEAFQQNGSEVDAIVENTELLEKIFASSVWRDNAERLLPLFKRSLLFYGLRFLPPELLGKLFSQINPENAELKSIIYKFDFGDNPGLDFDSHSKRRDFVRPILSFLLTQPAYRETNFGRTLIQQVEFLWKEAMKSDPGASFLNSQWALSILKLMDDQALIKNPTLYGLLSSIAEAEESGKLTFKGPKSDRDSFHQYLKRFKELPLNKNQLRVCRNLF